MWNSVQFLIALQGAVLAAGFTQKDSCVGPWIMVLGFLLTLAILGFVKKSMRDRDVNMHVMDALVEQILPQEIKAKLKSKKIHGHFISLTSDPPRCLPFLRGRYLLYAVYSLFATLDVALAVIYTWFDCLF
jgi:hypothetical protein